MDCYQTFDTKKMGLYVDDIPEFLVRLHERISGNR
jgi:hypothetical protein